MPALNSSDHGNYGAIVTVNELVYPGGSALTTDQWDILYAYQLTYGVRMVRLGVSPTAAFGVTPLGACCADSVEQSISLTNTTGFVTANLKSSASLSTQGLYHYPAVIASPSNTWEIAQFAPSTDGLYNTTSTAAVINNFNGRQQMVFFLSWATQWSQTSSLLQHAYIHWMLRGLFVGARKIHFNTQVDDIHLQTALYSPANAAFRLRPADLDMHVIWQTGLNSRLPAGSNYFIELAHNGNGDIYNATRTTESSPVCSPSSAIIYPAVPTTDLEFYKSAGTGTDVWPADAPSLYVWSSDCAALDPLATWFLNASNRDSFSHVSHTFTHLYLNNASYNDAAREISFNRAWITQLGLDQGAYSSKGLVPPAITGMHNGDAVKAWLDNGITAVTGDNSRPLLVNQQNEYWPLLSTTAANGYDGLWIMGRWPTRIYFNCDLPECNVQQWNSIVGGAKDFKALLELERVANTRALFQLRQDAFMFHQANLRSLDVPVSTVGSITGQLSLLQSWVETVAQEMARLTNWPLVTLKHDDLAQKFIDRSVRDACSPNLSYTYSTDGSQIVGFVVTAKTNSCTASIPITLPGSATASTEVIIDQVGAEPEIEWVELSGTPVTFTLATPIAV